MLDTSNEVLLSFLPLTVSAKGSASIVIGVAVAFLILAIAWRLVTSKR